MGSLSRKLKLLKTKARNLEQQVATIRTQLQVEDKSGPQGTENTSGQGRKTGNKDKDSSNGDASGDGDAKIKLNGKRRNISYTGAESDSKVGSGQGQPRSKRAGTMAGAVTGSKADAKSGVSSKDKVVQLQDTNNHEDPDEDDLVPDQEQGNASEDSLELDFLTEDLGLDDSLLVLSDEDLGEDMVTVSPLVSSAKASAADPRGTSEVEKLHLALE